MKHPPIWPVIPLLVLSGALVSLGGSTPHRLEDQFDAWVEFTDKGIRTDAAREAVFLDLERSFDPRAINRRKLRRTREGLFDEYDLPLHAPYLKGVSATGADVRVESRWLNGVTVLATREQLVAIETLPYVREVTDIHPNIPRGAGRGRVPSDPDLRPTAEPPSGDVYGWSGPQIRQLNIHLLHEAGFTGSGIRIGVIDTGFLLNHPALDTAGDPIKIAAQWDFVDNDSVASPESDDPLDQHEHGTLILGILAANRHREMIGSAPDAEFILLKAEDGETEYFLEEKWFAAALEYAERNGADVVTSSLVLYQGYDSSDVNGRTSIMAQAWNLAVGNGVIGLQGGGNSGHDDDPSTHHLLPPAGAPGVITVGAVDSEGEIAFFSSDGLRVEGTEKPELLAWGDGTASISPYQAGGYTLSNGTSMATPLLAGGVACLLQAHPDWSVQQMKDALRASGDYYRAHGRPDPLFVQGYGIPDLAKAIEELPELMDNTGSPGGG